MCVPSPLSHLPPDLLSAKGTTFRVAVLNNNSERRAGFLWVNFCTPQSAQFSRRVRSAPRRRKTLIKPHTLKSVQNVEYISSCTSLSRRLSRARFSGLSRRLSPPPAGMERRSSPSTWRKKESVPDLERTWSSTWRELGPVLDMESVVSSYARFHPELDNAFLCGTRYVKHIQKCRWSSYVPWCTPTPRWSTFARGRGRREPATS